MNNLGSKVLNKIQNLIAEIDRPVKTRSSIAKKDRNIKKQQPAQLHPFALPNSTINTLAYSFRNHEKSINQKLKTQRYEQQNVNTSFKVINKTSLRILNKKQIKPIHQRIDEIVKKRQNYVKQVQNYYKEKQTQSMIPQNNDQRPKKRNLSPFELHCFRENVDQKNKLRLQKKHLRELQTVKKEKTIQTPTIDSRSIDMSVLRNLKKKYSINVFQRLYEDNVQRKMKICELKQKTKTRQGSFSPILCPESRSIFQKKYSNSSVFYSPIKSPCHSHCKRQTTYNKQTKNRIKSKQLKTKKQTKVDSSKYMMTANSPFDKQFKKPIQKIQNKQISISTEKKTKNFHII